MIKNAIKAQLLTVIATCFLFIGFTNSNAAMVTFDEVGIVPGDLTDGTAINGATFSHVGTVVGLGNQITATAVPPLSGQALQVGATGGVQIEFGSLVNEVSVDVFTFASPVRFEAFNSAGTQIAQSAQAAPGFPGSSISIILGSADISKIIVHDSGTQFLIDNINFQDTTSGSGGTGGVASAPEPGPMALMALGLGALALGRRLKIKRV